VFAPMTTRAKRDEILDRFDPSTSWCTDRHDVVPQRTQRFPSRSRAARLSFCHAKPSSSGREDPERWGLRQRAQRPRVPAPRRTPQPGQRRASIRPD
jgi:hypothetical protein